MHHMLLQEEADQVKCIRKGKAMINVDYVKYLMDKEDMSQKMLAIEAHVTESCVSRFLSGKRSGSLELLEGLARAFPDTDLRAFLQTDRTDDSG